MVLGQDFAILRQNTIALIWDWTLPRNMTNWRRVMIALAGMLFLFGLLQFYDMTLAFSADNYIRALIECLGGGLVMFASFIIWGVDLE
jgi:hypothetical protein